MPLTMSRPPVTLGLSMTPALTLMPHRPVARRPRVEQAVEPAELAAAASLLLRPAGGPLGLHEAVSSKAAPVEASVRVGKSAAGHPEVHLALGVDAEARLTATPRGLELALVAASEPARRQLEGRLVELVRALEARGLHVSRCRALTRVELAREQARR
jgi:hypothetical protein